jgi:DHA3 family macrolide efflux protein-like MFS transporter
MPGERRPSSPRIATFLAVESLSSIGSFATVLVIWGYAAYEYDASAADVALVGLSFSLPSAVLGPLAGTVVDRIGAKATLAGAKVLGVVASLLLLGAHDLRTLGLLSFLHGIASAFSMPALQSLPPRIVDEQYVARTNALVSLTDELAITVGPVVGALAIAAFGFRGAFIVDAVTYGIGLVALPMVRLSPVPLGADGEPEPKVRMRDAFEGLRLVARSDVLRRLVTCTFLVHMLYGAAILSEPLYVRDVLERQPSTFAALQSVFGVFLVGGGILAARLGDRLAKFGFVVIGIVGSGFTAILYMGTSWIVVSFIGVALWGCATALISGPSRTLLQRASPVSIHGRVMSTDLMAGSTAELTGLAIAGVCVSLFGVQWTFLGLGTFVILATLRVWQPRRTTVDVCAPLDDSGSTPSSAGASRSASPR